MGSKPSEGAARRCPRAPRKTGAHGRFADKTPENPGGARIRGENAKALPRRHGIERPLGLKQGHGTGQPQCIQLLNAFCLVHRGFGNPHHPVPHAIVRLSAAPTKGRPSRHGKGATMFQPVRGLALLLGALLTLLTTAGHAAPADDLPVLGDASSGIVSPEVEAMLGDDFLRQLRAQLPHPGGSSFITGPRRCSIAWPPLAIFARRSSS